MKTNKMAETAARYGMTPAAFERLLAGLGWMVDGEWSSLPLEEGFVTAEKELTIEGQGFLAGYLWRSR